MDLENVSSIEQKTTGCAEIPENHLEKYENREALENMPLSEASKEIGKTFFSHIVLPQKGLLNKFCELSKSKEAEKFADTYSEYITDAASLKESNPELHDFMKTRIFSGREYGTEPIEKESSISFGSFGPNRPDPCSQLDIIARHNAELFTGKSEFSPESELEIQNEDDREGTRSNVASKLITVDEKLNRNINFLGWTTSAECANACRKASAPASMSNLN